MKNNERFQHLLKKYRSNRIADHEYREFIQLMKESGEEYNQLLDDQVKIDWGPSKELLQQFHLENIEKQRKKRQKRILAWSSAAAIAVLVLSYFIFWAHSLIRVV